MTELLLGIIKDTAKTYIKHWQICENDIPSYYCNGVVVERRRTLTQAAESVKIETTAGVRQQSGFICSAADNFQHTQNPHSHAYIRERRGPQGTHAIATIKSALWTTKWLTIVFRWPAQIQFPQQ